MSKKDKALDETPIKSKKELKEEAKRAKEEAKQAEKQAKIDAKNKKKNKGQVPVEEPVEETATLETEANAPIADEAQTLDDLIALEDAKEDQTNAPVKEEAKPIDEKAAAKALKKQKKAQTGNYFSQTFGSFGFLGMVSVAVFFLICCTIIQAVNPIELAGGADKVFEYLFNLNNLPMFIGTVGLCLAVLVLLIMIFTGLFSRKIKLFDAALFVGILTNLGMWVLFLIDNFEKASIQDAAGNIIFSVILVVCILLRSFIYKPSDRVSFKYKKNGEKIKFGKYLSAVGKRFNFLVVLTLSIATIAIAYTAFNAPEVETVLQNETLKNKVLIMYGISLGIFIFAAIVRSAKKRVSIVDFMNQFMCITSVGNLAIGVVKALGDGTFDITLGKMPILLGAGGLLISLIWTIVFAANTYKKAAPVVEAVTQEAPVEDEYIADEDLPLEEAPVIEEEDVAVAEAVEDEEIPVAEAIEDEEEIPVAEAIEDEEIPVAEEVVEEAIPVAEEVVEEEVPEALVEESVAEEVDIDAVPIIEEEVVEEAAIEEPIVEEEPVSQEVTQRLDNIENSIDLLGLATRVEKIEENTNTINDINARIDKIEQNVEKILQMLMAGAVVGTAAAVASQEEEYETVEEIPATPEIEETVEEIQAPVAKANLDWQKEVTDESRVKPKLSFEMKLRQLDDDIKGFYSDIKNALMSYGIKNRISRFRENFNKGRNQIARFTVNGKTLCLYLAIDPDSIDESYYHHKSYLDKKGAVDVPTVIKIRSKVAARKAIELIDIICESLVIKKKKNFTPVNYVEEFTLDGFTTVECKGLDFLVVGEMDLAQATQLPDGLANQLIELVEGDEAVFNPQIGVVKIDDLQEKFEDGDIVDLQACKDKRLVAKDCNYLSITEGAYINKKLRVFANEYNADAVKMICLSGGEAFMIVDPV